jgi:O-antigen/teichoic acid export membrane protein
VSLASESGDAGPRPTAEHADILGTPDAGPAAVRGGAYRVGGYIVVVLVGAVAAALIFRHLGDVDTGHYVVATSLVAIVAALSDLGLTAVGVREISLRPPSERWRVAQELLGLRLVLTVIGGIVVTGFAAACYSPTLAAGVGLASIGLLLQVTQDNFSMPLVVDLRLGWVASLELLRQVLSTLLILVLVLLGARLVPLLGVTIPVGALMVLCTVAVVRGQRAMRPVFDWQRWKALISAMLPYSAAVAAAALYLRISMLIVSVLCDKQQVGYFGASFKVVEVVTILPALLAGSAFPIFARAARDDHERLGYALGRVFEVSLIVGAWASVSIAIGASLAIDVLGGAEFHPAAAVLALQGVTIGVMFVSAVWANGMLGLGLYRQIMIVNMIALAGNAAIVTAFVELGGGARGAAIGTAIAEICVVLADATIVVRGRPALKPRLRVIPRVALATALGLTPMLMTTLPVVVRLVISTSLFAATLIATRALPPELGALLPATIRRRIG